jgi:hypothetical protein
VAVQAAAPQKPLVVQSAEQQKPPKQRPDVQSAERVQDAPPWSKGSQLPFGPVQKKPLWQSASLWQIPRQALPPSLQT